MAHPTFTKAHFTFLKELKENNNRDWFNANKPRYQEAYENLKDFAAALADEMTHHDKIEGHRVYRIYRDIRFSKDKTPYKYNLSGGLTRATNLLRGGYYFHIQPNGGSFVGGGFWGPSSADLKRIRTDIAADPQPLRDIIADPVFIETFGELQGDQVKTAPKGFSRDHPAIDLLRYKQFLISKSFSDKEVLSPDFLEKVNDTFRKMRPFFDYMSEVLTTDANGMPIV
jgi:uncharacterized protein (TIGR02453 family)